MINDNETNLIDISEILNLSYTHLSEFCEKCLNIKPNFLCPHYLTCPYQKKYKANVVINEYKDKKEILFFKDAFWQRGTMEVNTDVDRTRKFMYDDNGILVPKDEDKRISIFELQNVLKDSRKRGIDNFYAYINANEWQYFITLTIENTNKVNKYDDDQVKYIWQLFRQKMQRRFKNIKILAVPENHKKGGIHFHGLLGNVNLSKFLTLAINSAKTYKFKGVERENEYYLQPLKTKYGDQVYNLDPKIFNSGFVQIVNIKDNNQLKISNYMSKYMAKDYAVAKYNKKLYFHTCNLDFRTKQVSYLTQEEKQQIIDESNLLNIIHEKQTDKFYSLFIKK